MKERKNNQGYEITNEMFVENEFGNEVGFVVGYSKGAPCEYVTWKCNREQDSFINGHYFVTKEAALQDFFERAAREVGLNMEMLADEEHILNADEDLEHSSDRTELDDLDYKISSVREAFLHNEEQRNDDHFLDMEGR